MNKIIIIININKILIIVNMNKIIIDHNSYMDHNRFHNRYRWIYYNNS